MTQITKTTLRDAVIDDPIYRFRLRLNTDEEGMKFIDESLENIDVDGLRSRWSSSHNIAIFDDSKLTDFWTEFDAIVKQNKITDSDKVYFTKSSIFPRSSFNRYSDKARLVQTTKAATKYVISDNLGNTIGTAHNTLYLFEKSTPAKEYRIYVDINTDYSHDALTYFSRHELSSEQRDILKDIGSNRWNTPVTKAWFPLVVKYLNGHFKTSGDWTCTKKVARIMTAYTLKEKNSAPFLTSGEVDLENFVNDTEVNRYIDKFKGEFDDSMYDYLMQTLSAETSDPEVPMQLLTNMSIALGNPRLDALFINLPPKAKSNIVNHRVMRTVDVKNFVKTHSLQTSLDYYSSNNVQSRMTLIAMSANKYDNEEDRIKLFELTREGMEKMINEQYPIKNIKICMKYEEVREPDGTPA